MLPRLLTRALAVLVASCAVGLSLLAGSASAAPLPGTRIYTAAAPPLTAVADVSGGAVTVTVTNTSAAVWRATVALTREDPRTYAGWSESVSGNQALGDPAYRMQNTTYAVSSGLAAGGGSVVVGPLPLSDFPYLAVWNGGGSTTASTRAAVWVQQLIAPAAPTTTAPATTAPSTTAPATTSPPTTTAPPTSTEPPSGGGTGSGITCTTEAPCPVTVVGGLTVNADGLTVQALTDEQWGELLLALGALTFFSAASFASSWRRTRN